MQTSTLSNHRAFGRSKDCSSFKIRLIRINYDDGFDVTIELVASSKADVHKPIRLRLIQKAKLQIMTPYD